MIFRFDWNDMHTTNYQIPLKQVGQLSELDGIKLEAQSSKIHFVHSFERARGEFNCRCFGLESIAKSRKDSRGTFGFSERVLGCEAERLFVGSGDGLRSE